MPPVSQDKHAQSRRWTFSLRFLFAAVTLSTLAIFVMTIGWKRQQRIVSMLTAKGATLTFGRLREDGKGWNWSSDSQTEDGYCQQIAATLTGSYPKLVGFHQNAESVLNHHEVREILSLPNLQRIDLSHAASMTR